MLTLPKIVERAEQRYFAVAEEVRIPFGPMIDGAMGQVADWLGTRGKVPGIAMFKYNVIDMPRLEMEFGFLDDLAATGEGRVAGGILPAGHYATLTYLGPYDDLESVTAMLMGWARHRGIDWDSTTGPAGERFVSRFELYPNGPMDEPDPQKWETQIFIRIRD